MCGALLHEAREALELRELLLVLELARARARVRAPRHWHWHGHGQGPAGDQMFAASLHTREISLPLLPLALLLLCTREPDGYLELLSVTYQNYLDK